MGRYYHSEITAFSGKTSLVINAWFGPQRLVLVTIVSERSTCLCESRSKRSERTTLTGGREDLPRDRRLAQL